MFIFDASGSMRTAVGTRAGPAWHWMKVEGFSCNGKAWVHVGAPWGKSFKIPPKMPAERMEHVVETDWSNVKAVMGHG